MFRQHRVAPDSERARRLRRSRALVVAWLVPAVARAAEEHEAAPGLFSGDIGNVFWTLLVFGLVVWVLSRYAWGPLLSALQRREEFIRESLEKARQERQAAEERLREYEERLATAHAQAAAIVEEGRRDAEAVKGRIEEAARQESQAMLERAKREIRLASDQAVRRLYSESGRLAVDLAGRILRREVRPEDHARLIQESLDELAGEERPS